MLYLDYNATSPCDPLVVEAMLPYFTEKFGNAASTTHPYGWVADEAVKQARVRIAESIQAGESEIVFTSGSTEGCNLALQGVFNLYQSKGKHIITCATEHKAVLDTCKYLETLGARVTYLPVDSNGNIDVAQLEAAITEETILIAMMYANNETGVLHPISVIGSIAKQHKVLFFCDATQAWGKVDINVEREGIDLMAVSAHKLCGPKGVGALYVRRKGPRVSLAPLFYGGGHERGRRSGTLNVTGIVGMAKAIDIAMTQHLQEQDVWRTFQTEIERMLLVIPGSYINGAMANRLTHVTNISLPSIKASRLISKLNTEIAFSVGSACTAAQQEPSHVLKAMGLDSDALHGAIRLSWGRFTKAEEIKAAAQMIKDTVISMTV
jgi:cysteine desulfurase